LSLSSRSATSVSAVVVSHDEGVNLARTVHVLLATLPRDGELVVVDDCSTDGSADVLADSYPTVRVLRTDTRLGVAAARNFGARRTAGEIVLFADAHVDAPLGWFEPFASALEPPEVGVVGPGVSVMGNDAVRGYGMTWTSAALRVGWLPSRAREPYPVPILGGCFVAMRRNVFEETGGWDEGLVGWGYADSELALRLWTLGYECVVIPAVCVAHLFRRAFPYRLPADAVTHNLLRVAGIHFAATRFAQVVRGLTDRRDFSAALARFVESDALRRQEEVRARRRYDDDWFCKRFGIDVFDGQEGGIQ